MANEAVSAAATRVTSQISLFTNPAAHANVASLATKLANDHGFREAFIADPTSALKQVGIPVETPVTLTERDKLVLRLIGDKSIETLYKSGNIAGLRQYIATNYSGLAIGGLNKADVAADFDVLIETEVVAVAEVAAVAIAVADIVASQGGQVELQTSAVANARIAALEARVQMLESQLATKGGAGGP
jgi:hypothetical protein